MYAGQRTAVAAAPNPQAALEELCRRGFRRTRQRKAVIQAVFDLADRHPTVEEVHRQAARHVGGIGMATVYRTLTLLVRMGMISSLDTGDGRTRYEPHQEGSHHHVICIGCGLVVEIPGQPGSLDQAAETGFAIIGASVSCFGYCPECQRAGSRPNQSRDSDESKGR